MSFTRKNLFLLGFIVVLLAAIPITVFILQKQQQTQSGAVKSTTLNFLDAVSKKPTSQQVPLTVKEGDEFSLDVILNPGTNQVGYVTLKINFDPQVLATSSATSSCQDVICPNPASLKLEQVKYKDGEIGATLSKELDISRTIQTETKIATVTFKALKQTASTQISFSGETIVRSNKEPADDPTENVLSTTSPAWIAITQGASPSPTITPTSPPSGENETPVCTSLNIDREATGPAPLSLTFTANGTDTDGTISKVTFNFGDGPVQDITQAGGIGTNTVSVQNSHTFVNAGTFQASAILTDDKGGISDQTTCTKTITVSGPNTTIAPTSAIATPTPTQFIAQPTEPGPGAKLIGIGAGGIILTIISSLIFLAL